MKQSVYDEALALVTEMRDWWARHQVTRAWCRNDPELGRWIARADDLIDYAVLPDCYTRAGRLLNRNPEP